MTVLSRSRHVLSSIMSLNNPLLRIPAIHGPGGCGSSAAKGSKRASEGIGRRAHPTQPPRVPEQIARIYLGRRRRCKVQEAHKHDFLGPVIPEANYGFPIECASELPLLIDRENLELAAIPTSIDLPASEGH